MLNKIANRIVNFFKPDKEEPIKKGDYGLLVKNGFLEIIEADINTTKELIKGVDLSIGDQEQELILAIKANDEVLNKSEDDEDFLANKLFLQKQKEELFDKGLLVKSSLYNKIHDLQKAHGDILDKELSVREEEDNKYIINLDQTPELKNLIKSETELINPFQDYLDLISGAISTPQIPEPVLIEDNTEDAKEDELEPNKEPMAYIRYMKHALDRKRETMPQIASEDVDQVVIHFAQNSPNVKVTKKLVPLSKLKPTQSEINEDKVNSMSVDTNATRFIVSKNYYMADSHHHWAAIHEAYKDAENEPTVTVYKINLEIGELLRRLNLMKVSGKKDIADNVQKSEIDGLEKSETVTIDGKQYTGEWKTVKGNKVFISGGKLVVGPDALKGGSDSNTSTKSKDSKEQTKKSKVSSAVANYQSTNFDGINNELRYDKPDKYKDVIKKIDSASTDKTSGNLYRGLSSDYTKNLAQKYGIKNTDDVNELKQKLIGKTLKDKGYMSTTRDLKTAGDFARDKGTGQTTVMQISGEKEGVEVSKHVDNHRSRQEQEFIIKRGTEVTIKDVSISNTGKVILYAETTPIKSFDEEEGKTKSPTSPSMSSEESKYLAYANGHKKLSRDGIIKLNAKIQKTIQNKASDLTNDNLTGEQVDAVTTYVSEKYKEINNHLRGLVPTKDKSLLNTIGHINEAISKNTLKEDMIVYRSVSDDKHLKSDKAFQSVSIDPSVANNFSRIDGSKVYAFKIPAGTNYAYLGGSEKELVLNNKVDLSKYVIDHK